MLPIGPQRTVVVGNGFGPVYRHTVDYTQAKPYNLPLDVDDQRCVMSEHGLDSNNVAMTWLENVGGYASRAHTITVDGRPRTDNSCYARFAGKLSPDSAEIGITLAEHRSAVKSINMRCKMLFQLLSALRKRDFRAAGRALRTDVTTRKVKYHKEFANNLLEWSWGWSPMIDDIQNAMKVLTTGLPPFRVRASAGDTWHDLARYQVESGPSFEGRRELYLVERHELVYRCSMGAVIAIDNPNLWLANQLGVVNVPGIVWATFPFSFIVDKYINIGQMINSLSTFYGLRLIEPWYSRRAVLSFAGKYANTSYTVNQDPNYMVYSDNRSVNGLATARRRRRGLLQPSLVIQTPGVGSLSEAVSYMALILQLLTK